jgi:hypothetical protein
MKMMKFKLTAVSPILMRSGARLPNPLDPICKEMAKISGKRKKSDSDFQLLSDLEYLGSLYTTEPLDITINGDGVQCEGGGKVCVASEVIEATLIRAAKKSRMGETFKSGLIVDTNPILESPNLPTSVTALFAKRASWRDIRPVKVQRSTVMRTRPIFRDWSLIVSLQYMDDLITESQVKDTMTEAGQIIGICDYRPKYGRFNVEVL